MQKGLKIPRSLSLFLVLTVISVMVFTIFILVLPPFIKEFNEILVDIPNGLSKINILVNTNLNKLNNLCLLYTSDFDRFMRFANSYAKSNGLGYSEKK